MRAFNVLYNGKLYIVIGNGASKVRNHCREQFVFFGGGLPDYGEIFVKRNYGYDRFVGHAENMRIYNIQELLLLEQEK